MIPNRNIIRKKRSLGAIEYQKYYLPREPAREVLFGFVLFPQERTPHSCKGFLCTC